MCLTPELWIILPELSDFKPKGNKLCKNMDFVFVASMDGVLFFILFQQFHYWFMKLQLIFYVYSVFCKSLKLFTNLNIFFHGVFRFPGNEIISFTNKDNLLSSFLIMIPFISFSCSIALARSHSTVWNNNGKSSILYYCILWF
jgi:hypothetical protein